MTFTHERFDRHSLFSSTDRSLVLDIIGKISTTDHPNVVNMLFGLFDGFYYIGVLDGVHCIDTVDEKDVSSLSKLLFKVRQSILASK
jgi:hypothetical protein